METTIKSIAELERFAKEFLEKLTANDNGATVVGLSGELGSGKTAFVKAVAKALGVKEEVLSPTFVIAKFYKIPQQVSWPRLVHVDAYRIEDPCELKALKWQGISKNPRNLVFIEWPENIKTLFPTDALMLTFRFIDETTRMISS
ncbi:MAG: tRNA (adenosine(37)-N6)-threonylcarbamoyltransferase complex ATPase subunit type 1 TsaE [bacterium]|nr:tRNA (adenosine(37)-N6)-threonylcarbamoyltransferase complex ATPase subunit type 1 TsaE [bacterium]